MVVVVGGVWVEGLVGKVAGLRTMIAASKRGLHGFPLSSCTCHYGITDATSTFFSLFSAAVQSKHTSAHQIRQGTTEWRWSCSGQQVECSAGAEGLL